VAVVLCNVDFMLHVLQEAFHCLNCDQTWRGNSFFFLESTLPSYNRMTYHCHKNPEEPHTQAASASMGCIVVRLKHELKCEFNVSAEGVPDSYTERSQGEALM